MPTSNACQLVLKYLLMNKNLFIKAYHNRVYAFSSGSKFSEVMDPLQAWLKSGKERRDKWEEDHGVIDTAFKLKKIITILSFVTSTSTT